MDSRNSRQKSIRYDSHGFHGNHGTRLTWERDYTECNGFHELGPLRAPDTSDIPA